MTAEQRRTPRRRTLKGAAIWFKGRMSTMTCVIKELSEDGCRIRTDGAAWTPDEFELQLGQGAIIERCEVIWRRWNEIGVRFVRPRPPAPASAAE